MRRLLSLIVCLLSFCTFAAEIPQAVLAAKQSTFRLVMQSPKAVRKPVPITRFEQEYETHFSEDTFMGWWFRKLGSEARAKKLEECFPRATFETLSDGRSAFELGSGFLAGDSSTLYTAAHVWLSMFSALMSIDRTKVSDESISKTLEKNLIGMRIDFILFNEKREIVFDSSDMEDKDAPVVKSIGIPSVIDLLRPDLKMGIRAQNMEYLVIDLRKALPLPALKFATVKTKMGSDEPAIAVGTPFYSLGYPGNAGKEDLKAIPGVYTDKYRDTLDSVTGLSKKDIERLKKYSPAFDTDIDPNAAGGMSGGPIVNERGEVFGLNSRMVPSLGRGPINVADLAGKTFPYLMLSPPPTLLPGVIIEPQ